MSQDVSTWIQVEPWVHHQFFISSSSVLHQFFISSSSALHQLFISSSSVLHQFFISYSSDLHQLFLVVYGSLWQSVAACASYFPTLAKNNVTIFAPKARRPTFGTRLSTPDYPSYIFSISFVFLNSLLFCVISTVQWSGATSICDGIIVATEFPHTWTALIQKAPINLGSVDGFLI